jgi:hypothetical protein
MREFLMLKTDDSLAETVKVSALIDGKPRLVSDIQVKREVLVQIFGQFLSGELEHMSFDDHPKQLTGIVIEASGSGLCVKFSARSMSR